MGVIKASTIIVFIVYLTSMVGIGVYFYRKDKDEGSGLEGYLLGGRDLNPWVAALSAGASDMSGWLLMGLPGAAYISGFSAGWIGIGLAIGTWANWQFVSKRFRIYSEVSGDSITMSDYFENRFKDDSGILRMVSAIFILFFFFVYTSSGFVASAKLFGVVFNMSYVPALILGAVVIMGYTVLGGFAAVSWTDLVQGTLMIVALIGVPVGLISTLGGLNNALDSVRDINPNLLNFFSNPEGGSLGFWATVSLMSWGLGYPGQPHVTARFMAIRSHKDTKAATVIGTVWVIIGLFTSVMIGTFGIAYFVNMPLQGTEVENVFMLLIQVMLHPAVAGLFLAAVLAAVMSTADSQLLVTSSSFTKDFYQVFFNKEATDEQLVKVSRISVFLISIVAFLLALNPESKVLDLVSYAWAGLGATFGPIVIMSVYWRDMTRNGAIAGMVTGGLTVILWPLLTSGGLSEIYELLPAFIFAILAIVIVSKLGTKPNREVTDEFDKMIDILNEK